MKTLDKSLIILFFTFFLTFTLKANNPKKIKRLLTKAEFLKSEEIISELIQKDSNSVNANYCFSLLLTNKSYPKHDLEKAYTHIQNAISSYSKLKDLKKLEKLKDWEVTDSTLKSYRKKIDSLVFEKTFLAKNLKKYHVFLERHKTANTEQRKLVENLMQEKEFELTKQKNTFQAYLKFCTSFPNAKQHKESMATYERLVFEEKTKDASSFSFQNFLAQHPKSPYRNSAEKDLFRIIGSTNDKREIIRFILDINPHQEIKNYALGYLKEILKAEKENTKENFSQAENEILNPLRKQIKEEEIDYFFVGYEPKNESYEILNSKAKVISTKNIKAIPDDYKCGGIEDDFFLYFDEGNSKVRNLKDELIFEGKFEIAGGLGYGFIQYLTDTGIGIIHQSKWKVSPAIYEEIEVLSPNLIQVKKANKYGIIGATGIKISDIIYDEIQRINDFIILKKDGKFSLQNRKALNPIKEKTSTNFKFEFSEIEKLNDDYILAFKDNLECVFNSNLERIIPLDAHEIYHLNSNHFYTEKENKATLYLHKGKEYTKIVFDEIEFNNAWIKIRKGKNWGLIANEKKLNLDSLEFKFNEIDFLNAEIALTKNKKEIEIHFAKEKNLKTPNRKQLIRALSEENSDKVLLEITEKNGAKKIVNHKNEELVKFKNPARIEQLGVFLIVEQLNKKFVYNLKGKRLFNKPYDAVSATDNPQTLTILRNKKFGLIYLDSSNQELKSISPKYTSPLSPFGDHLFLATSGNKDYVITDKGINLTKKGFDEIHFFQDSIAIVLKDKKWKILDLDKNKTRKGKSFDEIEIIGKGSQKILKVKVNGKEGLYNPKTKWFLEATFNNITNVGSNELPIFCCEKYVPEASIYAIVYYNQHGKKIRQTILDEKSFHKISCDDL